MRTWWQRLRRLRDEKTQRAAMERQETATPAPTTDAATGREPTPLATAPPGAPPSIAEILSRPSESPLREKNVADFVEEILEEARTRGDFENLPGKGKPFPWINQDAGEDWLVQHIMEENHIVPPWLELDQEIRRDLTWLREHPSDPRRAEYIQKLNRKIDDFNLVAPSLSMQRPRYRE